MAMGWVAAGTALVGGYMSSQAANNAADAQAASASEANATQRYMYDTTRADQAPYRDAGYESLGRMREALQTGGDFNRDFTMADFVKDPGYQFRLEQGEQAVNRSAAAGSGLLSGATLKALNRYGQDFASQEYGNAYNRFNNDRTTRFNRQAALAGIGQTANNTIANAGQNFANNVSANQLAAGNARAAGYVGAANGINSAVTQGLNIYQGQQMMNALTNGRNNYPAYDQTYDVNSDGMNRISGAQYPGEF